MRRLPVVYETAALRDLVDRQNWIETRAGARTAIGYCDRVRAACDAIGRGSGQGRRLDELSPGLRVIGFEKTGNIYFKVVADEVRIARVLFHGRDAARVFSKRRRS